MTTPLSDLRVKIFADGADLAGIKRYTANPLIEGFTTNPSLMRKAGVADYKAFAEEVLAVVGGAPISFEVFADEPEEMERQARAIASWGKNIYVKIPVTNTAGESMRPLIAKLSWSGVKVNVTALMTVEQVAQVAHALSRDTPAIISVFAGRVADTGRDPEAWMEAACHAVRRYEPHNIEVLWASTRELWNIHQAARAGCDIITVTDEVIAKFPLGGKDLDEFSLETVKQFYNDAQAAGYTISTD